MRVLGLVLFAVAVLTVIASLVWRWASRLIHLPCPAGMDYVLENPYVNSLAGADNLIRFMGVESGMSVLDVGCGPGRVTLPLARAVGPAGRVCALDLQERMLARVRERCTAAGLSNIDYIHGGAGTGLLPENAFDRALLVTVLGEIPERGAALDEIRRALKPGGVLAISELLPDPHYQSRGAVRAAGEASGFEFVSCTGTMIAHTTNLRRPPEASVL